MAISVPRHSRALRLTAALVSRVSTTSLSSCLPCLCGADCSRPARARRSAPRSPARPRPQPRAACPPRPLNVIAHQCAIA
eukprot:4591537-Prymnesium_polylepis.1